MIASGTIERTSTSPAARAAADNGGTVACADRGRPLWTPGSAGIAVIEPAHATTAQTSAITRVTSSFSATFMRRLNDRIRPERLKGARHVEGWTGGRIVRALPHARAFAT